LSNACAYEFEEDFDGLSEQPCLEVESDMATAHGFYYLVFPVQYTAFDLEFCRISKERLSKYKYGQGFLKLDARKITFDELLRDGVVMMSEVALFEGDTESPEPLKIEDKPLSTRERDTLLTIIGVLLELIQSPVAGRDSEAAVIKEMLQNYDERPGIKKRTLEQKFAEAKRILGNR
jgi:hypothetical protein